MHADERVLLPLPGAEALDALRPRLEADVREAVALAPVNLLRRPRAGYVRARREVVDLRDVACGPDEPYGNRLRLRLGAELRDPLATRRVAHAELRRVAALLRLNQTQPTQIGPPRLAARPVEEVERLDAAVPPHDGRAARHLLRLLLGGDPRRRQRQSHGDEGREHACPTFQRHLFRRAEARARKRKRTLPRASPPCR